MKNFIKLNTNLLSRKDINSNGKLLIAYLNSFQSSNLICHQTKKELSEAIGIPLGTLKDLITKLKSLDIIFSTPMKSYSNKRQFKNRKAMILVDENHPLPITSSIITERKVRQRILEQEIKLILKIKKMNEEKELPNEEDVAERTISKEIVKEYRSKLEWQRSIKNEGHRERMGELLDNPPIISSIKDLLKGRV